MLDETFWSFVDTYLMIFVANVYSIKKKKKKKINDEFDQFNRVKIPKYSGGILNLLMGRENLLM